MARVVRVVHSSDLHLGMDERRHGVELLESVLRTSRVVGADLLVLAGDVFDHNRVHLDVLDLAADALVEARVVTVILPGNHDTLVEGSVYRRGRFADIEGVHVLGLSGDGVARFPALDLEVWGRAHLDHFDMSPLVEAPPRTLRWRIAAAHGHWVRGPHDLHRAYLIHEEHLRALDADYVALGHWDVWTEAGEGHVPAYYSGSPVHMRTVNLVEFGGPEGLRVTRVPLEE